MPSWIGAVHKVRHTIFGQFLPPSPLSHFVTHPRTPRFLVGLVQKSRTKTPIVRGGFCPRILSWGLLSGRFCPGWVWSIPPSVRIHLLQQKVKHHFKFHVSYV